MTPDPIPPTVRFMMTIGDDDDPVKVLVAWSEALARAVKVAEFGIPYE